MPLRRRRAAGADFDAVEGHMVQHDDIRTAADLASLIKALVQETIEGDDEYETRGLMGARVLRAAETWPPEFRVEMPDGQRFQVTVNELGAIGAAAS